MNVALGTTIPSLEFISSSDSMCLTCRSTSGLCVTPKYSAKDPQRPCFPRNYMQSVQFSNHGSGTVHRTQAVHSPRFSLVQLNRFGEISFLLQCQRSAGWPGLQNTLSMIDYDKLRLGAQPCTHPSTSLLPKQIYHSRLQLKSLIASCYPYVHQLLLSQAVID